MMSPGRLWWQFRRDIKRGWDASYHDYHTLPLIEKWSWPFWGEDPATVPVHILTGDKDWRLAAWALASFFHHTEAAWPVVVHDDGSLSGDAMEKLSALFEKCRIISRAEADDRMMRELRPYPYCLDYRTAHPLALKIFDMAQFATQERFIVLDSDVLFFKRPREIIDWAAAPAVRDCWFNEDVSESTLVTATEARDELNVKLWSRVNSGLCLLSREAIDFDFCDRALATTSILRGHIWRVEQTLFALCASRTGHGGLLPPSYEVSLKRHVSEGAVARHYVGAVRDRFFGEGLKRLRSQLLEYKEQV